MAAICERCGEHNNDKKNRFCQVCIRILLAQMSRSGYLQDTHVQPYFSDERGRKGMRDMRVVGGAPYDDSDCSPAREYQLDPQFSISRRKIRE